MYCFLVKQRMTEPSEDEVTKRCHAVLQSLEDGKPYNSNDVKVLCSSNIASCNMRSPDNSPIGKLIDTIMQKSNLKQCTVSAEKCALQPGETVLEIGVGSHGYAMERLLKTKGLKKLVGIEISDYLRHQIRKKFAKQIENKELILCGEDCKNLKNIFPMDNSVDCILAINVVYFLHPLEEYLQEMYRVLKPQIGRILFSGKTNSRNYGLENSSSIFQNIDFSQIAARCKDAGFQVELENVHIEENSIMNDFTLIKLYKAKNTYQL